jgi:hypothetical protein
MGRGSTTFLDLDGNVRATLPLSGGFAVAERHLIFGSTGYAGMTVALDARTLQSVWSSEPGTFCGGFFDFDPKTGYVYEVAQCGATRDPLIVRDAGTGTPVWQPAREARVATGVVVDPEGERAFVSSERHVVFVHGPQPEFLVERTLSPYDALGIDRKRGRVFLRRADGVLAWVKGKSDPVATTLAVGPALAVDAGAGRVYVGEGSQLRVLEAGSLAELATVPLDGRSPLALCVDEASQRLYALLGAGSARSLAVFALDSRP